MRLFLIGKDGQVGWELQRSLAALGDLIAPAQHELDLEQRDDVRRWIRDAKPDVLVNAAAYTAVDKAESEPQMAHRINAEAVSLLADEAQRLDAWLVHYSTDYVFDGEKATEYLEEDQAHPLSVYGRTKFDGEEAIRARHAKHLIFRTSWVYAARGHNFVKTILRLARERERLDIVADQHGAPTSAELIADITALALYRVSQEQEPTVLAGTYHLVAHGETTWHAFAQYVVQVAQDLGAFLKLGPHEIHPITTEAYPLPAKRPRNSRLNTDKLTGRFQVQLPGWRDQVRRVIEELNARGGV
jgi:dTDP-4-dehydrorhamnose reductase